jgi:hypothetical protein
MKTLKRTLFILIFLLLALGWLLLPGCGTVAPKLVTAQQGSFDAVPDAKGDYQNSGVLGFTNHQLIVTPSFRARYNALVAKWGGKFLPPIQPDDGLTVLGIMDHRTNAVPVTLWLMDKDHLDKMATMTRWQAQPATTLTPAGVKPP